MSAIYCRRNTSLIILVWRNWQTHLVQTHVVGGSTPLTSTMLLWRNQVYALVLRTNAFGHVGSIPTSSTIKEII